jgi:hypothetical protein
MKVLFVTSSTTPYGGGSKSFLQMVKGVLSYGVNPLIVFPDNNGLFKIMQQEGIPCVALRYPYRMSIYPPTTSLRDKIRFIPRLLYSLIINNLATIQLLNITKKFKPDIMAPGYNILSCQNNKYGYVYKSGTSMSTPIISGLIALYIEKFGDCSVEKVRNELCYTAFDYNKPRNVQGCGLVDVAKFLKL